MSTLLERPDAQDLLDQAQVEAKSLRNCRSQLKKFLGRYLPCFVRSEHRQHAQTLLQGKLTALQRKTTEPIATQANQYRRPLQHFVGAGLWSDETVRQELCTHVRKQIGHADAVLVIDPSAFPKKGTESCGVARQWCGRLGKKENCQVGVFLAYVSNQGKTLVDAQLYLPQERANDPVHRKKTHVPDEVLFAEKWRIALELLETHSPELPHGWVTADSEMGRVIAFRSALRLAKEHYVLDVPCDTLIRDLSAFREPSGPGRRRRVPLWERVDLWAARQPGKRWKQLLVKEGTQGPLEVEVLQQWVQTKDEEGGPGARELLTVIRTLGESKEIWYTLSNPPEAHRQTIVRVHGCRHGIEELFEEGKLEIGLSHYEVRSWIGWAHHITLSLLALWFLQLERKRLGKKIPR